VGWAKLSEATAAAAAGAVVPLGANEQAISAD